MVNSGDRKMPLPRPENRKIILQRKKKQADRRDYRYQGIMRNLVRRYVTVEQRKTENEGVTEDDVNEIKQDISAFRCELINILQKSGMVTEPASGTGTGESRTYCRGTRRGLDREFVLGLSSFFFTFVF